MFGFDILIVTKQEVLNVSHILVRISYIDNENKENKENKENSENSQSLAELDIKALEAHRMRFENKKLPRGPKAIKKLFDQFCVRKTTNIDKSRKILNHLCYQKTCFAK